MWRGARRQPRWACACCCRTLFDQEQVHELDGLSLDRLDIECTDYTPAPELLTAAFDEQPVEEVLASNLLKSNCLVTGQPDWGSVQIRYSGPQIDQGGLLRYLVSFRNHNEFHEQCVERIFMDIWRRCRPAKLAVYARYTRRGGLDINPFRTSHPLALPPTSGPPASEAWGPASRSAAAAGGAGGPASSRRGPVQPCRPGTAA